MDSNWLELLEPYYIDDDLRALAYEEAKASERQALKTATAYHALQAEDIYSQDCKYQFKNKGFWQNIHKIPCSKVFIICHENYTSPARLIASASLAIFAQVPEIIFINISASNSVHHNILLALELLGLEDAFTVPDISIIENILNLPNMEQNRIIILGDELVHLCDKLQLLNIRYFKDTTSPTLLVPNDIDMLTRDLITFAHPDAIITNNIHIFNHATYINEYNYDDKLATSQIWCKGMEACWQHTQLNKDFFYNIYMATGIILEAEEF